MATPICAQCGIETSVLFYDLREIDPQGVCRACWQCLQPLAEEGGGLSQPDLPGLDLDGEDLLPER